MKTTRNREKGVALLLVLFALMIFSAVALSMVFSSDTETIISVNYRDKQAAIYGALAGLQEARARIHPSNGDLALSPKNTPPGPVWVPDAPPPKGAPAKPVVLYIVSGDDVKPWDPSNKYFDSELCQENVLGLTGIPGTPCSGSGAIPSGTGWFRKYTNTPGTQWYQNKPLYRWVRVMLKTNVMTPLPIPDDVTAATPSYSGTQLCFDSQRQHQVVAQPPGPGMDPTCGSTSSGSTGGASVTKITPNDSGSGYNSGAAPTVSISGGGGSGATAVANMSPTGVGDVSSITIKNAGANYTTPPTVTITSVDGNGSGATATAQLFGKGVTSVSVSNGNPAACYATGTSPTISFDTAYGSGATANATMSGTACIKSFTVSGSCDKKAYPNGTYNISPSGGSGSGFQGTVTLKNGVVSTVNVTNPGAYTSMPSSAGGVCSGMTWKFYPGIHITGATVVNPGEYSAAPKVLFSGASYLGNAPIGTATIGAGSTGGAIKSITIVNHGAGYTVPPTVTITGDGSGAQAVASIDQTYSITSYTITNPGSGYTTAPQVTVQAPPGYPSAPGTVQATAVATIGGGSETANGTPKGPVYELTALAETESGARAMAQMEVAFTYNAFQLGGALTLVGSDPVFGTPNSMGFQINGADLNSCGPKPFPTKPAIGVDPSNPADPTGSTAVEKVLQALGKPQNYIGSTAAPSVQAVDLGDPSPQDLENFAETVRNVALSAPNGHVYPSNPSNIELGTSKQPIIDVVDGDYTMGPNSGYGVLLVRGKLTISGNYNWHGLILVIGKGSSLMNGGGSGQITGSVYVANTTNGTGTPNDVMGSPVASWTGGGGNGVQYDHCWADNLLSQFPSNAMPSQKALVILSQRMLEY